MAGASAVAGAGSAAPAEGSAPVAGAGVGVPPGTAVRSLLVYTLAGALMVLRRSSSFSRHPRAIGRESGWISPFRRVDEQEHDDRTRLHDSAFPVVSIGSNREYVRPPGRPRRAPTSHEPAARRGSRPRHVDRPADVVGRRRLVLPDHQHERQHDQGNHAEENEQLVLRQLERLPDRDADRLPLEAAALRHSAGSRRDPPLICVPQDAHTTNPANDSPRLTPRQDAQAGASLTVIVILRVAGSGVLAARSRAPGNGHLDDRMGAAWAERFRA